MSSVVGASAWAGPTITLGRRRGRKARYVTADEPRLNIAVLWALWQCLLTTNKRNEKKIGLEHIFSALGSF